jgi:hypothetical protein
LLLLLLVTLAIRDLFIGITPPPPPLPTLLDRYGILHTDYRAIVEL